MYYVKSVKICVCMYREDTACTCLLLKNFLTDRHHGLVLLSLGIDRKTDCVACLRKNDWMH